MEKIAEKVKARNRPSPVFDSTHPKVKDNKDHFPLGDENQARNAIARVNQYSSVPEWYSGSLKSLQNSVIRAVKKKYPGIKISDEAKKPKKAELSPVVKELMLLKTAQPEAYAYAVKILRSKIAANESHNEWSPTELKTLLGCIED